MVIAIPFLAMKSFSQQQEEIRTRINRACYGQPYMDYLEAFMAFSEYAMLLEMAGNIQFVSICDQISEGYRRRAYCMDRGWRQQ